MDIGSKLSEMSTISRGLRGGMADAGHMGILFGVIAPCLQQPSWELEPRRTPGGAEWAKGGRDVPELQPDLR